MGQQPLPPSAERRELMQRLGCTEAEYRTMLDRAARTRDQMSLVPQNAVTSVRRAPTGAAPYRWDELSETARHREILRISYDTSDGMMRFYNIGRYRTSISQGVEQEENWVVRWFLWHSFRYRDNRDNGASNGAYHGHGANRSNGSSNGGYHGHGGAAQYAQPYYDPVYGQYRVRA